MLQKNKHPFPFCVSPALWLLQCQAIDLVGNTKLNWDKVKGGV